METVSKAALCALVLAATITWLICGCGESERRRAEERCAIATDYHRCTRGRRVAIHRCADRSPGSCRSPAEDVEPWVPISAARMVGDHSMSRPAVSRRAGVLSGARLL
jgi:hypothetical protein